MGLSFGFNGEQSAKQVQETKVDVNTGEEVKVDANGEEVSIIDNNNPDNENQHKEEKVETTYEVGTVINIDDNSYTIDDKGNLVDKDGQIFKEAKDVDAYLKEFDIKEANETTFDINSIIEQVGVKVTDEDGTEITFENTPEGVAAYIQEVNELKRVEYAKAGVESLIKQYPIINDFLNYYIANGNSYEGFGEQKDRSSIVIDENNEAQQEAIIRESWKESKRNGDVNAYIKYLKDTNQLKDVAKSELESLQEHDKQIKEQFAKEAQENLIKEQQAQEQYWNMVKETINSKQIAGYKLPEVILLNKDGKQVTASLNDFYNYVYQVDDEGYSRYERALMAKDVKTRCEQQLLAAYLEFTGNDYTSLINLALADEKKKQLVATANNKKTRVTITKPTKKEKENLGDKIASSF